MSAAKLGCLGRYELLEELGRDGIGAKYRARDLALPDRQVALEEVRVPDGALALEGKLLEARSLERVHGLHVAAIREVFAVPERSSVCVVSELLVGGETLRDRMARGPLQQAEIVSVLDGILDALETMHGTLDEDGSPAPIPHRALKPENVFFQPWRDGEVVKVMGFGIARIADDERRIERALASLESSAPWYASPEVLFGEVASPAADLWSAGVILWELLVGRHPFDDARGMAASPAQLLVRNQGVLPPLPDDARSRVPGDVAELLRDLCAHDPALRPTARQARDRLARASLPGDGAASSRRTGARSSGARWSEPGSPPTVVGSRRARALVVAGVVVGVLCVAGGLALLAAEMAPVPQAPLSAAWPTASVIAASPGRSRPATSAPSCPELLTADPFLASLPVPELERRILASGFAERQLEALRLRAASYGTERRDCVHRVALIATLQGLRP